MDVQRTVWTAIVALFAALAVCAVVVIARDNVGSDDTTAASDEAKPTLVMSGLRFRPAALTVARGTEVLVDNRDTAPHTVTADDGSVDTGLIDPGKAKRLVIDEAFSYFCALHPSMQAEFRLEG